MSVLLTCTLTPRGPEVGNNANDFRSAAFSQIVAQLISLQNSTLLCAISGRSVRRCICKGFWRQNSVASVLEVDQEGTARCCLIRLNHLPESCEPRESLSLESRESSESCFCHPEPRFGNFFIHFRNLLKNGLIHHSQVYWCFFITSKHLISFAITETVRSRDEEQFEERFEERFEAKEKEFDHYRRSPLCGHLHHCLK